MKRRLLSLTLVLCMAISLLVIPVYAEEAAAADTAADTTDAAVDTTSETTAFDDAVARLPVFINPDNAIVLESEDGQYSITVFPSAVETTNRAIILYFLPNFDATAMGYRLAQRGHRFENIVHYNDISKKGYFVATNNGMYSIGVELENGDCVFFTLFITNISGNGRSGGYKNLPTIPVKAEEEPIEP